MPHDKVRQSNTILHGTPRCWKATRTKANLGDGARFERATARFAKVLVARDWLTALDDFRNYLIRTA